MGLMEPGCTLEDFGRPAQPAAPNRLRCRAQVVSERYLRETLRKKCVARIWPVHGELLVSWFFRNVVILLGLSMNAFGGCEELVSARLCPYVSY